VLSALAGLYAAAFALPDVDIGNDDCVVPDRYKIRYEEWASLWNRLGELLGDARYHWGYFDPTEPRDSQEKPIIHDLADDLADIYRDIQDGLRTWDADVEGYGPHTIWTWRFNFQYHWGHHAVGAMRALHQLVFYRGLPDE
jgi:hypothetical protein